MIAQCDYCEQTKEVKENIIRNENGNLIATFLICEECEKLRKIYKQVSELFNNGE